MPIYEYTCRACAHHFEEWVRKTGDAPTGCPECGEADVERRISMPRVHSENSRANSLADAKRREMAGGKEKAHAQRQYELSHDD